MTTERTFLESLRVYGIVTDPEAPQRATTTVLSRDDHTSSAYLHAALDREAEKVRNTGAGSRSHELNAAAYSLGQLVAGAGLDEHIVRDALISAAIDNGHIRDDGEKAIQNTITSGLTAGKKEPRGIPELRPVDVPTITPFEVDPDTVTAYIHEHMPRLDWHKLWTEPAQEDWIVEPILPARRLVALYSPPKVGKSLLMLEIAVAVATGQPVLGTTVDQPRRVLYVDFENDPQGDILMRLQDMGREPHELDNLVYLSFPSIAALDSIRGGQELLAAVRVYGCEVVVIDTLGRSVAGEENDNDTWMAFYRNTGLQLKKAGIALIRLDHTGKDETKGQRGGSAKSGDVDAIWKLSRVTDDTYQLHCDDARMPIVEKTVVMHRRVGPLRHHVDPLGGAAAWDARVGSAVKALDIADVDVDTGGRRAREVLRAAGVQASNAVIAEAVRRRKQRVPDGRGHVGDTYVSPYFGDTSGTHDDQ